MRSRPGAKGPGGSGGGASGVRGCPQPAGKAPQDHHGNGLSMPEPSGVPTGGTHGQPPIPAKSPAPRRCSTPWPRPTKTATAGGWFRGPDHLRSDPIRFHLRRPSIHKIREILGRRSHSSLDGRCAQVPDVAIILSAADPVPESEVKTEVQRWPAVV